MEGQVRYIEDLGIIETRFHGNVTQETLSRAREEARELAVQHSCTRFLSDLTDASLELSAAETTEIPKKVEEFRDPLARDKYKIKGAILASERTQALDFLEHYMTNRGLTVKVFLQREAALDWLLR